MGESRAFWTVARSERIRPRCLLLGRSSGRGRGRWAEDDQTENGAATEDGRSPQRPDVLCSNSQAVLLAIVDEP